MNVLIQKKPVTFVLNIEISHYILLFYLYSIGVFHISFLFVKKNTVQKIKEKLKNESVIILLHSYKDNKGIYYVLKNNNIPSTICKIKSNHKPYYYDIHDVSIFDVFINNFGKHYTIEYDKFNYNTNISPEIFMNNLKKLLYN